MPNTLEELEIIVKANTSEAESKLKELKDKIQNQFSKAFKEPKEEAKDTEKVLDKVSKSMTKSFKPMLKLSSILKGSMIFALLRKLLIESANGIKDLSQYSSQFNKTMSSIKSGLLEARNAITASYAPAIQALEPLITSLTKALTNLFNSLARVTTILFTNNKSFIKAKNVTTNYAQSVKKAKNELAGFDELNVISGGDGNPSPYDMFETEEIDPDKLEGFSKWAYDLKQQLNEIDFTNLLDSFDRLKQALEPYKQDFFDGLYWFKDNILVPFSTWVIEKAIPDFFDLLSAVLKVLHPVIEKIKPLLTWLWDNFLQPILSFAGDVFISYIEDITGALEKLSDFLEGNTTFDEFWKQMSEGEKIALGVTVALGLATIAFYLAAHPIVLLVAGILILVGIIKLLHDNWDKIRKTFEDNEFMSSVLDLVEVLWNTMKSFGEFLIGIFTGDWEKACDGAEGVFKGFVNIILSIFEIAVNGFVFAINGFLRGINWAIDKINEIPGVELKKLTLLKAVEVPQLAKGGVLKKSTIFQGGEYPGARSNPEIVTPQSLMYETNLKANVPVINAIEEMTDTVVQALRSVGVYAEFDYDKMRIGIDNSNYRAGEKLYGV